METCFTNLVEPGDKVIVCQNGVFGGRMKENVERTGGTPVMVEDEWGKAVDLQKVEDALQANPDAKIVAFVHAETSTGAQSDAPELVALPAPRSVSPAPRASPPSASASGPWRRCVTAQARCRAGSSI
jgi:aspartate aminotransferase-like enzyme